MKTRGRRKCQSCGAHWSYYETGVIECPDCGSLQSVGVGDRALHTDTPVTLDLSVHRASLGDASITLSDDRISELKSTLREYLRKRGFIRGGELCPLDATYLAGRELLEAIDCYDRLRSPTDRDREYLLCLLAGVDDGDRPPTERVPDSLREARGMAAVHAVNEYRNDLLAFLDELASSEHNKSEHNKSEQPNRDADRTEDAATTGSSAAMVSVSGDDVATRIDPARTLLERLRDRSKRAEALTGDIPPSDADALTEAVDAIGEYVRTGESSALERAKKQLAGEAE